MKKIIAAFVLFFAVSLTANAQEEKKSNDPLVLAKNELNALVKVIQLDNEVENGLYKLLVYKHETLAKSTTDVERNEVYKIMKDKISGTLTPEQLTTLKSNKELYNDLLK
jgi:outer membrane usher protein FimD/PapC